MAVLSLNTVQTLWVEPKIWRKIPKICRSPDLKDCRFLDVCWEDKLPELSYWSHSLHFEMGFENSHSITFCMGVRQACSSQIQYLSKSTKITRTSIIPINLIKQPPHPERFLPPARSTLGRPPRHSFQSLFSGGQSPARASGHFNQSCCLIQNKYWCSYNQLHVNINIALITSGFFSLSSTR